MVFLTTALFATVARSFIASLSGQRSSVGIQGFLLLGHHPNLQSQPHPLGQILEILGT